MPILSDPCRSFLPEHYSCTFSCKSRLAIPTSLDAALVLLHDYLKEGDRPLHLLGHSTGGLLGLLYAHRYPERVRSLTLLSVGVHPAIDWQAHYYIQRQMLLLPLRFPPICMLCISKKRLIAKTCYLWVQTIFGKLNKVSCDRIEISSSPLVNLLSIMNKHFGSIKTLIYHRVGSMSGLHKMFKQTKGVGLLFREGFAYVPQPNLQS